MDKIYCEEFSFYEITVNIIYVLHATTLFPVTYVIIRFFQVTDFQPRIFLQPFSFTVFLKDFVFVLIFDVFKDIGIGNQAWKRGTSTPESVNIEEAPILN